jgi:hypothetical protein
MKIYKYITSVAILSFCFLSACNKPTETKIPVPVIFDTDVGNDIDDVLAMQMLFNYENAGTIDLLGITISKSNPYSIEYIDGYCRLNERGDIPLGYAYNGATPEDGGYLRQTLDTIIEGNKYLADFFPIGKAYGDPLKARFFDQMKKKGTRNRKKPTVATESLVK